MVPTGCARADFPLTSTHHPVDVQVTKPLRQDLMYTITLPAQHRAALSDHALRQSLGLSEMDRPG